MYLNVVKAKTWAVGAKRLKSGEVRRRVVVYSPELSEFLRLLYESGVRRAVAVVDVPGWGVAAVRCSVVKMSPPYSGYGLYPLLSDASGLQFVKIVNLLKGNERRAVEVVVKAVEPL